MVLVPILTKRSVTVPSGHSNSYTGMTNPFAGGNTRPFFMVENNAPALSCQLVIDNPLPLGSVAADSNLSEGSLYTEKAESSGKECAGGC
jgi:hypothetical protein